MEIENQTNRSIHQMFDLMVGTSTGGILTLGLGSGIYTAAEMIQLYKTEGKAIFSRPTWRKLIPTNLFRTSKYPAEGLEEILKKYFGPDNLGTLKTKVMVTAQSLINRRSIFFKSWERPEELVVNVARATSAAPTFFPPTKDGLIDGGTFANNPAIFGLAQAVGLWPGERFLILSLGCGEYRQDWNPTEALDWGLIDWLPHLVEIFMDAGMDAVDYTLRRLTATGHYLRIQPTLEKTYTKMDNTSKENLYYLEGLAYRTLDKHREELKQTVAILKNHETE